jgi:hypothetical protein
MKQCSFFYLNQNVADEDWIGRNGELMNNKFVIRNGIQIGRCVQKSIINYQKTIS